MSVDESTVQPPNGTKTDETDEEFDDPDRRAQLELLAEENRRLRREYASARTSQYRRTALGFAALGVLAIAGGVLFEGTRAVLFSLGGVGLFASLVTYYLTPEQFVAASVGERVYAAIAAHGGEVVNELGLSDSRVYVPVSGESVRLFVPREAPYELPAMNALESSFVITDTPSQRGVTFVPTGQGLFAEFERTLTGELADTLGPLADQLGDALVEQFELVQSARVDVDAEGDRVTVGVSGSTYGAVDRFDHPVSSFLAVGAASGLDEPVRVTVDEGDDRAEYLVTIRREAPTSENE